MKSDATNYDVIIIGAGIFGLCSAWYALSRGKKVLLLEQSASIPNPGGSSHGENRMFRVMYDNAPEAKLAESSLACWRELEKRAGHTMLDERQLLFFGDPSFGGSAEGALLTVRDNMRSVGMPFSHYPDISALEKAYPGVFAASALPSNYVGMAQQNSAATIIPNVFASLKELSAASSVVPPPPVTPVEIQTGTAVTDIRAPTGSPVSVTAQSAAGATEQYECDKLIVCPGAWANMILGFFGLKANLKIWKMSLADWRLKDTGLVPPMWFEFAKPPASGIGLFYGIPYVADGSSINFKCAADAIPDSDKSDEPPQDRSPNREVLAAVNAYLQERFGGVFEDGYIEGSDATCLYTVTPDSKFVVDFIPTGNKNVVTFMGGSGRGFKFGPVMGRILVELALDGKTSYDISAYSIERSGILV